MRHACTRTPHLLHFGAHFVAFENRTLARTPHAHFCNRAQHSLLGGPVVVWVGKAESTADAQPESVPHKKSNPPQSGIFYATTPYICACRYMRAGVRACTRVSSRIEFVRGWCSRDGRILAFRLGSSAAARLVALLVSGSGRL